MNSSTSRSRTAVRSGALIIGVGILLSGCGGSDDKPSAPAVMYTVGGSVTGLNGSITLTNNGGDARTLTADGAFTFATSQAGGATYSVAISTQPGSQNCTVNNATGVVAATNVSNVAVTCVTKTYTVGGTVSGLTGSGLVLQNNGGDNLARNADGSFAFASAISHGNAYNVSVLTQPSAPAQTCTVTSGAGNATANVTNVAIACVNDPVAGSASIGAAGGIVSGYYGAKITVPAGALSNTITIGLQRDSTNAPSFEVADFSAIGAAYELTPHGTTFASPVTVRVPFDPTRLPNDAQPVLYKAETGGSFTALPTTVSGNFLEASISSFSWVLPVAQAVKPRMVYAVRQASGPTPAQVVSMRINRSTGALSTATSNAAVGEAPYSVIAHPSRRFLYVLHGGNNALNGVPANSIGTYVLSDVNGSILMGPIASTSVGAFNNPVTGVVHPSGKFLYVITGRFSTSGGDLSVYNINNSKGIPSAGTVVTNGNGAPPTSVAFNRTGTRAYVTFMWTSGTPVGNTFYDQVKVFNVDPTTGAFSGPIASAATANNPWHIKIDVNDKYAYIAALGGNAMQVFSLGATGTISSAGSTTVQDKPGGLALDAFGRFAFVGKQQPFFNVNLLSMAINASSGLLSTADSELTACIGGGCVGMIAVESDPQGEFVYALDVNRGLSAYSVAANGALTSAGVTADIQTPLTTGVGDPFRFAVTGTSPVWQSNCTFGCAMTGLVSTSSGSTPPSNPNPPTTYQLTVTQGAFIGVVTSSPAGINYGPPTQGDAFAAEFGANTTVQLCANQPTQPSGAYDIAWMGSCSSTNRCASVHMTKDQYCHVEFTPVSAR